MYPFISWLVQIALILLQEQRYASNGQTKIICLEVGEE